MPVVHIRALEEAVADPDALLLSIGRAVSDAAECSIGDVWCTWSPVARMSVGEQLSKAKAIVYVDVLMRARGESVTRRVLAAAAAAAAEAADLSIEDVWVRYQPVEPGRLFAGGDYR